MENYLEKYLQYLKVNKDCALKTIENYNRYLRVFLDWAKISEPNQINIQLVDDFRLYLRKKLIKMAILLVLKPEIIILLL